jgi:hypothetical protein
MQFVIRKTKNPRKKSDDSDERVTNEFSSVNHTKENGRYF